MKDSTIAVFTDGSSLINPGPTDAGAVIFSAGMNKPPIKLAKGVFSKSTNYNGEIDAILLALKHILSGQSQFSANTIHIFSNGIAAINAITSFSPQEINHDKIEEIIRINNSLKCFSFNVTYSPAHCGITQNEEADRLAKVGAQVVRKMIKGQEINLGTAKAKNKTLSFKIWETRWDRLVSCKYQSIVPKIDQFTIKRRRFLLKHTSSKMIRKIFRLKSSHNLLPAHKSKYDLATPSNCLTCETPFNEHHLLFECKNLQLLQNNLKTMISNTLSFHYHNSPRIILELL